MVKLVTIDNIVKDPLCLGGGPRPLPGLSTESATLFLLVCWI